REVVEVGVRSGGALPCLGDGALGGDGLQASASAASAGACGGALVADHVPDLAGQQVRPAQSRAGVEQRTADPCGQPQIDDAVLGLPIDARLVEGGEADVVVHQHVAPEL